MTHRFHVCWEGPQFVNHSLALVNRELELQLEKNDAVDLTILPFGPDSFAGALNPAVQRLRRRYRRASRRPVDIHVRHQWPPNWNPPSEGRWVVIQPWEYGSLPVEWVEAVNTGVDEVWVPSTFVQKLYINSGVPREQVHVVPNGVDPAFFKPGLRSFRLPSLDSFKFLFVGGTIFRKGIDILLKAYQQAFRRDDPVILIIKDMGTQTLYQGQGLGDQIRALQHSDLAPKVYYLEQELKDTEIAQLYNSCHCLVHPYRGEGFGLPVLEAMSCGLPVIVTAGGATDDFVNDSTGYRLPAQLRVFGNREISGLKTVGDLWMLEPDVGKLSERMRWVFEHQDEALETGARARENVEKNWTWRNSAEKAVARMLKLCQQPVLRFQERTDSAVLVDLESFDPAFPESLGSTIESLRRNAYAQLKICLWQKSSEVKWNDAFREQSVEILKIPTLRGVLDHLKQTVRARFLILLVRPFMFSRQWYGQIASVAGKAETGPSIFCPSTNVPGSDCFVAYSDSLEDSAFQKFARMRWRCNRERYHEIHAVPSGMVMLSWQCLNFLPEANTSSWLDWISTIQLSGAKAFWVQDTFLAEIPTPVAATR